MVRHTSTVVAVPSQADTQLSPMGVAWSTNALVACSLRMGSQDSPRSHCPIVLCCPENGREAPMPNSLSYIFYSLPARYSWYSVAWGRRLMFWHPPQGARRRAVRWRHPSSWSRCRSGEVPDRSARCLKKGGSPAMFHRPALLKSTCTKRVEVSQTPTLILERRKGSRNSEAKPQFGHRDGVIPCDRCCSPWASCLNASKNPN